ncbi:riboflavin synthase subunit alpha [Haloprofundus marisrubri]|uniref:Riboflavin synthase n=1 Tax=Haloprofundus marisrubri TaxID=1514971 RepID=A0A0W1R4M4_9EURY|nr:riboflavin synthase [Haloprofundus marisrubri]KTG08350.1 riboflavin synthase subunit alpha [Haloprofundus marisrubri]
MYTGLVEATGKISKTATAAEGRRIRVSTEFASDLAVGDSIAVSGVCLTVERRSDDWFEAFATEETLRRTYLSTLGVGDAVNLERPMPADGRFDGHVVKGTVDTTGTVAEIRDQEEGVEFVFEVPDDFAGYLVEKGAVAVDGASLTVADYDDSSFSIAAIPETLRLTTLTKKNVGDPVHLEADVLAKYVERRLAVEAAQ